MLTSRTMKNLTIRIFLIWLIGLVGVPSLSPRQGAAHAQALTAPHETPAKTVQLHCSDASDAGAGLRKCGDVKRDAKKYVRDIVGHLVYHYYHGKLLALDDKKSFCVQSRFSAPVCSLGEISGSETASNRESQNCNGPINNNEGFCGYPVKDDFSNCGRERTWVLHGGRIQAWQHALEQVESEIEEDRLRVDDWSANSNNPARMCDGYAQAISRLLEGGVRPGLVQADAFVRENFPAAELKTVMADACPRDGYGSNRGPASNRPNKILREGKGVSFAACHVSFARRNIETLYNKLAACEVWHRAAKTHFLSFERTQAVHAALQAEAVEPCLAHARQATGSTSNDVGNASFMSEYNNCYKGKIPGKGGAQAALKSYLNDYVPVEGALPYHSLGDAEDACGSSPAST